MNSHRFKLYRAYSISFTSSNVGKCFYSWILKDCIKVQEKKRKLLSCVPVLDKTWIQALSRCSRATTAKKCTKKAWCTCKVVVLLIKPIAFLPFSLPSASSLLKLPIIWTGELPHLTGLPHLPGVPHLHVNRPLKLDAMFAPCCASFLPALT